MRTATKSFAVAFVVSTLLTAPVFAASNNGKHPRNQDQQPTIVQRVVNHLKRLFDVPIIPIPDAPSVAPSDVPIIPIPGDSH